MGRSKKRQVLRVFLNGFEVGKFERQTTGALQFSYSSQWLASVQAMAISNSLPLREEVFRGDEVYSYFENLLPDNQEIRKRIAEKTSAKSSDAFDLLTTIGRDCVGALQFLPESESYSASLQVQGRRLKNRDIAQILKNLSLAPFGMGTNQAEEFRISLAGAHEKTALLRIDTEWFIPEKNTPTTHILKPAIGKLPNGIDMSLSVENEWLCLKICERLGLEVARAEIHEFEGIRCLVVERFDREWKTKKNLIRLPVEDLCQALGISSVQKYENQGGAGIVAIEDFLNISNRRNHDRLAFFQAQIVFHLLAATDGHAKNFSLFLSPQGCWMTPLYDILSLHFAVSKRQMEKKSAKLAMAVGQSRHYRMNEIKKRHWLESAEQCGISINSVEEMWNALQKALDDLFVNPIELPKGFPSALYDSILSGIKNTKKNLF